MQDRAVLHIFSHISQKTDRYDKEILIKFWKLSGLRPSARIRLDGGLRSLSVLVFDLRSNIFLFLIMWWFVTELVKEIKFAFLLFSSVTFMFIWRIHAAECLMCYCLVCNCCKRWGTVGCDCLYIEYIPVSC